NTDGRLWYDYLRPYIPPNADNGGSVSLRCPEFEPIGAPIFDKGLNCRTGYHFNGNLGRRATTQIPTGLCRRSSFPGSESSIPFSWDDVQETNFDGGWPYSYSYWSGAWYQLSFRHNGSTCNLGMLDGHVQSIVMPSVTLFATPTASDFTQIRWEPFVN
ncbi:MAG TPA: hypothetical protein PK082_07435, partial [Phycisphaerae bacterium]|nr:hypothetical protein [Phycisphaerae bacterium]